MARLKSQVEAAGGRVRIWVHPYYMGDDREYIGTMEKVVSVLDAGVGVPNIFFIPDGSLFDQDRLRLLKLAGDNGGRYCYFVRTDLMNPRPIMAGGKDGWAELRKLLRDVGVMSCLVGGERSSDSPITDPDATSPMGCVNEMLNQLSVDFDVERSNVAFPYRRADAIRSGITTGKKGGVK